MVKYRITNGHGCYIRFDKKAKKYVQIRSKMLADSWDQKFKASNILENMLLKKDRKYFYVEEFDDGISITESAGAAHANKVKDDKEESKKPDNTGSDLISEIKKICSRSSRSSDLPRLKDELSHMREFIQDAETRKGMLITEQSNIDREITDLEHYIEFNKLDMYKGYLLYSALRNRLIERRKVKNELSVIQQLGCINIDSDLAKNIDGILDTMKEKIYTPRVLNDLFR